MLDVLFLLVTLGTVLLVVRGGDAGKEIGLATAWFIFATSWWTLLGLLWTAVRVRRIRKARKGDQLWFTRLAGPRIAYLITLGTATIVIISGINIISYSGGDENSSYVRAYSMTMVVVAWAMLHLAYTERYALMELENTTGQAHFDFPATERPSLMEYAYFAFAVGATFGATDVAVQTSRMRGVVLCHGVLSFVYNTAILGMVLSILTG